MRSLFDLSEKIAVVTGGYGHLGSAMVEVLNKYGAKVIVAGRSEDKFDVRFGNQENIYFEYCDILQNDSFKNLYANIHHQFGKIDIVVNNAHTAKGKDQEQMNDEEWNYTLEGVLGTIHKSIREIIPYMKGQRFGKIINISSMYGIVSPDFRLYEGDSLEKYTNPPHYGAAKAGLIQLTKYYAVYLGKYNIQVNAISPGPFPKMSIQKESPDFIMRLASRNPLGKIGKPEDLGGALLLLSSEGSDFITGQNIIVDGGWTIW